MVGMITSKVSACSAQIMDDTQNGSHNITIAKFPIIMPVCRQTAFQFHTCEDNYSLEKSCYQNMALFFLNYKFLEIFEEKTSLLCMLLR